MSRVQFHYSIENGSVIHAVEGNVSIINSNFHGNLTTGGAMIAIEPDANLTIN